MGKRRITAGDYAGLSHVEAAFISEYLKDFNPRRAAEAVGRTPQMGLEMLKRDRVTRVVEHILEEQLQVSHINAEWVLMELVDNHLLARQAGELNASNTALATVMKHRLVDAVATARQELDVVGVDDLITRIREGRQRVAAAHGDNDKKVSFI